MKIIRLKGGIGNQLFQYKKAVELIYLGETVLIDRKTGFLRDPYGRTDALSAYCADLKFSPLILSVTMLLAKKSLGNFKNSVLPRVFLEGYFQNSEMEVAGPHMYMLLDRIRFSSDLDSAYFENDCAAIHIRDYQGVSSLHQNLPNKYYQKISEKLVNLNIKNIVIFSEIKNQSITKIFSNNFNVMYSNELLTGLSDLQELVFMSQFKIIVCANSTFSWWAAWLSSYRSNFNSIVFAPNTENFSAPTAWDGMNCDFSNWSTV